MADGLYDRTNNFSANTKARGIHIRFELDAISAALDQIPPMVGDETGFTSTITVSDAVADNHAFTLGQHKTWPAAADAGGFGITNLQSAVNPTDAVNLSDVNALVTGGGTPSAINITDLNPGTGTASQVVRVSADGLAVEGHSLTATNIDTGTATSLQLVRVASGGAALEGVDPNVTSLDAGALTDSQFLQEDGAGGLQGFDPDITALDPGTATALQLIRVNSAGTGLEGHTLDLSWGDPKTGSWTLAANEKKVVNIASANITATLPATLEAGQPFTLHAYGGDTYSLTVNRNGHTITSKGVDIDSSGDGNLELLNGNTVTLVATSTSTVEIV